MKKLILSCALLCGTLLLPAVDAQSLVVRAKGGAESIFTLSGVRKITFSTGAMSIWKTDGIQSPFNITTVQKLLFAMQSPITTVVKNTTTNKSITVYPNPTTDVLFIKGAVATSQAKVYNLSGIAQSVPSTFLADGFQLNVSALPQGLYLIQLEGQTIKFHKQ
jgi:hypothetical protein